MTKERNPFIPDEFKGEDGQMQGYDVSAAINELFRRVEHLRTGYGPYWWKPENPMRKKPE
jgi:hypothetical protein